MDEEHPELLTIGRLARRTGRPDPLAQGEPGRPVRDPSFRGRLRTWLELNTPTPDRARPPGASIWAGAGAARRGDGLLTGPARLVPLGFSWSARRWDAALTVGSAGPAQRWGSGPEPGWGRCPRARFCWGTIRVAVSPEPHR